MMVAGSSWFGVTDAQLWLVVGWLQGAGAVITVLVLAYVVRATRRVR